MTCSVFRRKRGEKAPPLVVAEGWPVKKARLNGSRKKRTNQITFGFEDVNAAVVHTEFVFEDAVQSEVVPAVDLQNEFVLEDAVRNEPVLEDAVQNEPALEDAAQNEAVLDLVVHIEPQTEPALQTEETEDRKSVV